MRCCSVVLPQRRPDPTSRSIVSKISRAGIRCSTKVRIARSTADVEMLLPMRSLASDAREVSTPAAVGVRLVLWIWSASRARGFDGAGARFLRVGCVGVAMVSS